VGTGLEEGSEVGFAVEEISVGIAGLYPVVFPDVEPVVLGDSRAGVSGNFAGDEAGAELKVNGVSLNPLGVGIGVVPRADEINLADIIAVEGGGVDGAGPVFHGVFQGGESRLAEIPAGDCEVDIGDVFIEVFLGEVENDLIVGIHGLPHYIAVGRERHDFGVDIAGSVAGVGGLVCASAVIERPGGVFGGNMRLRPVGREGCPKAAAQDSGHTAAVRADHQGGADGGEVGHGSGGAVGNFDEYAAAGRGSVLRLVELILGADFFVGHGSGSDCVGVDVLNGAVDGAEEGGVLVEGFLGAFGDAALELVDEFIGAEGGKGVFNLFGDGVACFFEGFGDVFADGGGEGFGARGFAEEVFPGLSHICSYLTPTAKKLNRCTSRRKKASPFHPRHILNFF
jgi:hypothetical protein